MSRITLVPQPDDRLDAPSASAVSAEEIAQEVVFISHRTRAKMAADAEMVAVAQPEPEPELELDDCPTP